MTGVPARCVAHPARPSTGTCPVCGAARCAADAARWQERGCAACAATRRGARSVPAFELLVRAALAGFATAIVGGWVSTQYVDTHYFSIVVPGLVGLAAAGLASVAAGGSGSQRWPAVLAVAAAAGVLGTALGFRLVPGGQSPVGPVGEVAPPYLAAVVGAVLWPVLFAPPRSRRRAAQPAGRRTDS